MKLKRRKWFEPAITLALICVWGVFAFLGLTHRIDENAWDVSVALGFASATVVALLIVDLIGWAVDVRDERERSDVSE